MPLSNGYGVAIGPVTSHYLEEQKDEGHWPHYHIFVNAGGTSYRCSINLKSRPNAEILFKLDEKAHRQHFSVVRSLPSGYHSLAPNADSGALDGIRHPAFRHHVLCGKSGWVACFLRWLFRIHCLPWTQVTGLELVTKMQNLLQGVHRVHVFGEPYTDGYGIHNIHMNQGDPPGSQWAAENGVWQDGGILFEYRFKVWWFTLRWYKAIMTKFVTQSLQTDDQGHPA